MKIGKNYDYVGNFITGDKLRVSDPCYTRDTWCCGVIDNAKPGEWETYIKVDQHNKRSGRVAELMVMHSSSKIKDPHWVEQDFEIGVDSGQAGVFDDNKYPDDVGEYDDDNSFYGKVCSLTENKAGVLDFGAVSHSGWGDGSYSCYTLEQDNKVIAVKIIFIDDYENDSEDDYYEYEENNYYENYDDED